MSKFIKSVVAVGIHGRIDLECQFQDGVNIIYGKNGTGKTTLLHIMANLLNRDYERFMALNFRTVRVELSDGGIIAIELEKIAKRDHYHGNVYVNGKKVNNEEFCSRRISNSFEEREAKYLREDEPRQRSLFPNFSSNDPAMSFAYFPAFRTVIDAWAVNQDEFAVRSYSRRSRKQVEKTEFARSLFGLFVPRLDYPATSEIEWQLNEQTRQAIADVALADRTNFGEVPNRILELISMSTSEIENTESILEHIKSLSKKFQEYPIQVDSIWDKLSDSVQSIPDNAEDRRVASVVLTAYREALDNIVKVQQRSFANIERYLDSVNTFFEDKRIEISSRGSLRRSVPNIVIRFGNETPVPMHIHEALSSGERQILTLIYATTQMSQRDLILVDEPEISLHVDWQRKLLPAMIEQMPSKQLIIFTHSPIIGAKYRNDRMTELRPRPTQFPDLHSEKVLLDSGELELHDEELID